MYSLVNNGVIEGIYDDTIENIKKLKEYNTEKIIIPTEEHHKIGLNIYTYIHKSNKEKIKNGEIILKQNQILDEKTDCIITIDEKQVYENGILRPKTSYELYESGLITKEEYNEYIIQQRQSQYTQNLDGVRAELLDDILNSWAEQGLLNESQIEVLKTIQDNRANIKEQYPKQL